MKVTKDVQHVIKARIQEHKYLMVAISNLQDAMTNYIPQATIASHVAYANSAILLASYKKAAEALECVLHNMEVHIDEDDNYCQIVDKIEYPSEQKDGENYDREVSFERNIDPV